MSDMTTTVAVQSTVQAWDIDDFFYRYDSQYRLYKDHMLSAVRRCSKAGSWNSPPYGRARTLDELWQAGAQTVWLACQGEVVTQADRTRFVLAQLESIAHLLTDPRSQQVIVALRKATSEEELEAMTVGAWAAYREAEERCNAASAVYQRYVDKMEAVTACHKLDAAGNTLVYRSLRKKFRKEHRKERMRLARAYYQAQAGMYAAEAAAQLSRWYWEEAGLEAIGSAVDNAARSKCAIVLHNGWEYRHDRHYSRGYNAEAKFWRAASQWLITNVTPNWEKSQDE